jgi:hypothetical protein
LVLQAAGAQVGYQLLVNAVAYLVVVAVPAKVRAQVAGAVAEHWRISIMLQ